MAGETFKLNFITNGEGIVTIDEPIGFDSAPFVCKQKSKGYARDVFFGGEDENEFTFYRMRNHYLDNMLYYLETYGWEGEIKSIIEKDGIDNIIGDLDLQFSKTDQLEFLKCKVIQDNNQALLKRRSDINVDIFSNKDVDDNTITPIGYENVLVKSKPITQSSSWETPQAFIETLLAEKAINNTIVYYFNPAVNLTNFGIEDSLTFFENIRSFVSDASDFKIIEAVDNQRNTKVDISNLDIKIDTDTDNGGDGYIDLKLHMRYGADFASANEYIFFSDFINDSFGTYTNTNNYTFTIPFLSRGDSVWLYFNGRVRQSGNPIGGNPRFEAFTTINSMNVDITSTRVAYNTIVPSIRLIDGVSQVVKSISGLETLFPFADVNGEMYDQRIFNGNLLRNLTDKPFSISLDDIEKWLPEINGDYEVQNDDKVFFGKYEDFYTSNEIGVFTDVRFDTYIKSFNPRYAINKFNYKYKKYQSQKENEVENTFDIAHGESQWSVRNRFVENKKDIAVSFVRCSFYIDEQRRKAFDLDRNTSTQDDDTIFILDTLGVNQDSEFTETDFLQHTYNEATGYLKITNTGNFNFKLLGLAIGETFKIINDTNQGVYTIIELTDRYIVINAGAGSIANNGERITKFTYIVSKTTAPFISWSNEGFNFIDGIADTESFANLKYTIKRNVSRFYSAYLATCNLFASKPIKSTLYKNNGSLSIGYEGVQTIENQDFTPTGQILSPYMHEVTLVTDFNTFMDLQNKVRTERGYIRTYDANGHVIKMYPKEMTFKNTNECGELKIIGEEKYNQSLINITYGGLGYVSINDDYRVEKISYRIDGEKVSIMDECGELMYNPVFWQKVTVNNAVPTTKTELKEWLSLIS